MKEQKIIAANRKEFTRSVIHSMENLLTMFGTDDVDKTSYLLRMILIFDMELLSSPDFLVSVEKMVDCLKDLFERGKPEILLDVSLALRALIDAPGSVCQVPHRTLLIMTDTLNSAFVKGIDHLKENSIIDAVQSGNDFYLHNNINISKYISNTHLKSKVSSKCTFRTSKRYSLGKK